MLQVVGRQRVQRRRQRGTAAIGQLVGVELGPQAGALPRAEDLARLLDREGRSLHKHVTATRQLLRHNGGDHFVDQEPDILGAPLAILRRDDVGTQEGGGDP